MKRILTVLGFLTSVLAAYIYILRPRHLHWGTTPQERDQAQPGDELVFKPRLQYTRAIGIDAPPEDVWRWVVQMGQGRAGFYSYEWIENLLGCDIHNADTILPDYQQLDVGDVVHFGPEDYLYMVVARVLLNRALVLRGGGEDFASEVTWAFILKPTNDGGTRLLVRFRSDYEPTFLNFLTWRVFIEPASFIMEQKMLRGIKQRAEANVGVVTEPVAEPA